MGNKKSCTQSAPSASFSSSDPLLEYSDDRQTQESYEDQLRDTITRYRLAHNLSEHRMSLLLGMSGSYIRSISNGSALPSMSGMFNIIELLGTTPSEFFQDFHPLTPEDRTKIRLREIEEDLSPEDLELLLNLAERLHG